MLPCLNKQILGFECFGCGLQRGLSLFFHGDFIEAFKMYPAIYTLMPLGLFIGFNLLFKFKNANKIINSLAIASVVIIITSFIIKQIN